MTDNPYSTPAHGTFSHQPAAGDNVSWQPVLQPLQEVAGWSKFLGIMLIIIGVLYCLSIVGIIIGWLPIWLGVLMLKSSENVKSSAANQAVEGVRQLSSAIKIAGIAAVVFLGFMLIYIVFVIAMLVIGVASQAPVPAGL